MHKKWIVLTGTALGVLLLAVSAPAQWSTGGGNYSGDSSSTLFQTPTGSFDGTSPPVYYPYWHNYLDNMQREGGYQTVTGNYGGSAHCCC